jgi:hypothetical protein
MLFKKRRRIMNKESCFVLLAEIILACTQIQRVLKLQLAKDDTYSSDINNDLSMLRNIKHTMLLVKKDIEDERAGACTELVLRVAAKDFKAKIERIPDERASKNLIIKNLELIHRHVLKHT